MSTKLFSSLHKLRLAIAQGYPSRRLVRVHRATLQSGRPTPPSLLTRGSLLSHARELKRLFLSHRLPRLPSDHPSALPARPTSIGALPARRASSANMTGSDTRTSSMSVGGSTLALSQAATVASGVPTHSTNIISNAMVARLVLTLRRLSSSSASASTGPAGSVLPSTLPANDTSSTLRVISNLA